MSVYETFDEQKQFACRVIADHARTTAFSIADGILPGNEGRAYVLRKIMRRAIYHGREHLGFHDSFFYKVCNKVIDEMKDAYPELEVQRDFIGKMVRLEEERFGNTLTIGLKELKQIIYKIKEKHTAELENLAKAISGEVSAEEYQKKFEETQEKFDGLNKFLEFSRTVHQNKIPLEIALKKLEEEVSLFQNDGYIPNAKSTFLYFWLPKVIRSEGTEYERNLLDSYPLNERWKRINEYYEKYQNSLSLARIYDTHGVPKDLISVIVEENNFDTEFVDFFNQNFEQFLADLQKQSDVGKTERKSVINPIYHEISEKAGANKFHGYDRTDFENSKVVALVKDDQQINELKEGDEGLIVLNETPFYAESGGQVGDAGTLFNGNANVKVFDTFAPIAGIVLHKSKVEKGSIKVGDTVSATVDVEKRAAIRRNHTATHLVHAALREVLGTHVKQAGSVVAPQFLRFDFAHYQPISGEEIKEIEIIVNREILKNEPVNTNIMAYDDAKNSGAMALFGEKYGSEVRVLSIGDGVFSKELCGGTHVRATGDIGSFKITADEAVASGVRRIRAITGLDAFERFRADEDLIEKSLNALKTQRDNLPSAIEKLQDELKKARRENDDLKMKIATGAVGNSVSNGDEAKEINGVKVIAKTVDGLDKGGMRHLSDTLMAKIKSGVVILARTEEDKVSFIVRVSDDLTDRIKAGNIIKEIAPVIGGRGGGKADMAEGGGNLPDKLSEAIEASYAAIETMLS